MYLAARPPKTSKLTRRSNLEARAALHYRDNLAARDELEARAALHYRDELEARAALHYRDELEARAALHYRDELEARAAAPILVSKKPSPPTTGNTQRLPARDNLEARSNLDLLMV